MNFQFKERLKGFCDKYHIKVLSDAKRYPIFVKNKFFNVPNDLSIINTEPVVATEALITLDIPLSKLKTLADLEAVFFNNAQESSVRNIFEAIMDQNYEEKRIRAFYPSVQAAYEQYSLLLNLCREIPKKIKDLPE
jgi:hypothetical protein